MRDLTSRTVWLRPKTARHWCVMIRRRYFRGEKMAPRVGKPGGRRGGIVEGERTAPGGKNIAHHRGGARRTSHDLDYGIAARILSVVQATSASPYSLRTGSIAVVDFVPGRHAYSATHGHLHFEVDTFNLQVFCLQA